MIWQPSCGCCAGMGWSRGIIISLVGINSRLDTLQAAVLCVKLSHLESWARQRQTNAERYHALFTEFGLDKIITLPQTVRAAKHVWNQYTIRVPDGRRNELRQHLTAAKIGTEIYYPVPLHEQKCFASLGYQLGSLPETEMAARETLALPIFPELTAEEQRSVVSSIAAYFGVTETKGSAANGAAKAGAGAVAIPRPKFLGQATNPSATAGR